MCQRTKRMKLGKTELKKLNEAWSLFAKTNTNKVKISESTLEVEVRGDRKRFK